MTKSRSVGCPRILATEVLVVTSVSGMSAATTQRMRMAYHVRRRSAGGEGAITSGETSMAGIGVCCMDTPLFTGLAAIELFASICLARSRQGHLVNVNDLSIGSKMPESSCLNEVVLLTSTIT